MVRGSIAYSMNMVLKVQSYRSESFDHNTIVQYYIHWLYDDNYVVLLLIHCKAEFLWKSPSFDINEASTFNKSLLLNSFWDSLCELFKSKNPKKFCFSPLPDMLDNGHTKIQYEEKGQKLLPSIIHYNYMYLDGHGLVLYIRVPRRSERNFQMLGVISKCFGVAIYGDEYFKVPRCLWRWLDKSILSKFKISRSLGSTFDV